jgi:hypothetical protein
MHSMQHAARDGLALNGMQPRETVIRRQRRMQSCAL